jgi:hypothetical protein
MREEEEARILELENAITKVVSPEEFASWKSIKRVTPADMVYQCIRLFKYLVEVDPSTAHELCWHEKEDRHTFLGLHYDACPVCKKPLDRRKAVFWFAAYLLAKRLNLGLVYDDAQIILDVKEVPLFIELCNRLRYEMKAPTTEELEQLLVDQGKEVFDGQHLYTKVGTRQPSLGLVEPNQ